MVAPGWTLIFDVAPGNPMGRTGGIFNFRANLAGIITPLVTGLIVKKTARFSTRWVMLA